MRVRSTCLKAILLTTAILAAAPASAQTTLRIAVPLLTRHVGNPYAGVTLPSIIASVSVFDALAVIDSKGQVQPWLAKDWSSADGRVWRIKLRDDIKFANGKPLTARALVVGIAYMKSPAGLAETVASSLAGVESVTAVSDDEAEVRLKQPDATFAYRLAMWRVPEPDAWEAAMKGPAQPVGIGTGPFAFTTITPAVTSLKANRASWHPPKVDALEVRVLPDGVARSQAVLAGAVDIAMGISKTDADEIRAAGGSGQVRFTARMPYFAFATAHDEKSPIKDVRVRLAINYAVDREKIVRSMMPDGVKPTSQLGMMGAVGYVSDLKPFPYDPARARLLLKEAGYPNGIDLAMRMGSVDAGEDAAYEQAAADMRAAGIRLEIRRTPSAQMTQLMFQGNLGVPLFTNFARGYDTLADYRFRSCFGETGKNKPYYCDPQTLELAKKAQASPDIATANNLMQQVTRWERDNPPGVILWQGWTVDGIGPRVGNLDGYAAYSDYMELSRLTVR